MTAALLACWQRYLFFAALWLALTSPEVFAQLQPAVVSPSEKVDGLTVVLTKAGPYPQSFTHASGSLLLSVINRSGVVADTFSLVQAPAGASPASTATAASLLDLHSTLTKQRDTKLLNPLPGTYQIRFQAHPDWVVNITITAN
jgi:hypothetical protein